LSRSARRRPIFPTFSQGVEAGEEITIARGDVPIAKLTRIEKANDLAAVLAEARAARARAKSVTREEILAWKHEGARGV
jgi:antitoxin (DNA-binding transcriptional repressor) of toxin-antitoxin stability system